MQLQNISSKFWIDQNISFWKLSQNEVKNEFQNDDFMSSNIHLIENLEIFLFYIFTKIDDSQKLIFHFHLTSIT